MSTTEESDHTSLGGTGKVLNDKFNLIRRWFWWGRWIWNNWQA